MNKKIVLLKDLNYLNDFPVVDILNSEGYRLGCATTAIINFFKKIDVFPENFSNLSEMALYCESELETGKDGEVKTERFYQFVDKLMRENSKHIECYAFQAKSLPLEIVLTLLLNDFVALVSSKNISGEGHGDVIFKKDDKVFYNCFEMNLDELANIIYCSPENMLLFGRNLITYERAFMKANEMGSIKKVLSVDEKYMLTQREVFFLEHNLLDIYDKYPEEVISDLLKEKELILKNTGNLHQSITIIY